MLRCSYQTPSCQPKSAGGAFAGIHSHQVFRHRSNTTHFRLGTEQQPQAITAFGSPVLERNLILFTPVTAVYITFKVYEHPRPCTNSSTGSKKASSSTCQHLGIFFLLFSSRKFRIKPSVQKRKVTFV